MPHIEHALFAIDNNAFVFLETRVITDIAFPEFIPEGSYLPPEIDGGDPEALPLVFSNVYSLPREIFSCGSFIGDEKQKKSARDVQDDPAPPERCGNIVIERRDPVKANTRNSPKNDLFDLSMRVHNASENKLCLLEVSAEWRYNPEGSESQIGWTRLTQEQMATVQQFPLVLEPNASTDVQVTLYVPAPGRENSAGVFNFVRSWLARLGPLQFKLVLEDKAGNLTNHIFEFVNPTLPLGEPHRDDLMFLFVDDVASYERYSISFRVEGNGAGGYGRTADMSNGKIFTMNVPGSGHDLTVDQARAHVYKCLRSGDSEILWAEGAKETMSYKAWLLVDLVCQRVYGVRVVMRSPDSAVAAYFGLPLYAWKGRTFQTHRVAKETQTARDFIASFRPTTPSVAPEPVSHVQATQIPLKIFTPRQSTQHASQPTSRQLGPQGTQMTRETFELLREIRDVGEILNGRLGQLENSVQESGHTARSSRRKSTPR
eukprot:c16161_g1_i2.p1 GENE.c16161_g1_i2~~c16161_g1_i2.p1  ORF type:complete len:487 (+),score=97.42 c16161_g1_i2:1035-2495(+)